MSHSLCRVTILALLVGPSRSFADDASKPLGEPQLERPTLRSLGAYWIVQGDDDQDASIRLDYRKANAPVWSQGAPLFRVERRAHLMGKYGSRLEVPDDGGAVRRQRAPS